MQTASTAFANLLSSAIAIQAQPRVIAEWNHNRYSPISHQDNDGKPEATYGLDLEMYPFESVTTSPRPTRGVIKARTDQPMPIRNYSDTPPATRVYTADYDSKYHYWMSPDKSDLYYTNTAHTNFRLLNCSPTVIYQNPVWSNKLYLCIETGWTTPRQYQLQISTNGVTWTTVMRDVLPDSKGRIQAYRQDDGSWSTTVNYNNPTQLRGIRLTDIGLDRLGARLSLIEMGLRLERDLTSYVTGYSIDNTMSESDQVTPMGTISSNGGNVTLSNVDGTFTHDNASSMYYGLMDRNVKFTIDVGFATSPGSYEYIRQGTMFSEEWSGTFEVNVGLKDASKFLQEAKPTQMLMENVTIGKAIWRLLDAVGFTDYQYTRAAADQPSLISYYWTDGESTVWDTIQEICRTTQTAVYFDESGILQIKTRSAAFDRTQGVKWTLDGATNGGKLADIIDINPSTVYEANKVNIGYQKTSLLENNRGEPALETVWEPGGQVRDSDGKVASSDTETLVLRATGLRDAMTSTQMHFFIAANQTASWPYDGLVNIHGELIKFAGKQYGWYDTAGTRHYDWIYSTEDKLRYDRELSGPIWSKYNFFTGAFQIKERGYDYTEPQAHNVGIGPWGNNAFYGTIGGAQAQWGGGVSHIPWLTSLRLTGAGWFPAGEWYAAHRPVGQAMNYFGTRLRFPNSPKGTHQSAGIFFYGSDGNRADMYAVNVCSTAHIENANARLTANEIRLLERKNGTQINLPCIGPEPAWNLKGHQMTVVDDQWVDIDVHAGSNFTHVWINGKLTFQIGPLANPLAVSERMGLFVRGNTVADFEYFYAMKDGTRAEGIPDNQDFMDIVDGGFYSNQYYKDVLWDWRNVKKKRGKKTVTVRQQYANRVLDEFGSIVHEAREYDVVFNKFPVLKSTPDFSNQKEVVIDQYIHSPFGAKFIIANATRKNAILNGEDIAINRDQHFDIVGRTIQQQEEQVYTVDNPQAVRARGEISVDIDSRWIQSEGAAKDLGDWIIQNWSDSNDEVTANIYGNPLLQIGDLVGVNYAPMSMVSTTHKYYVIGITNSWDNGPSTDLTLRRARV
jgi:hypothetical protein